MAPRRGGIKDFYKQKKNTVAPKPSRASGKKRGGRHQTPALIADHEYGEEETKLRRFDLDMKYGPCVGMTRLQLWERAESMGLNPPAEIGLILRSNNKQEVVECLWGGRFRV